MRTIKTLLLMLLLAVFGLHGAVEALGEADRAAISGEWTFYEDLVTNSCSTESGLAVDSLPGGVPEPYRSIISSAAKQFGGSPALVAAVFYWENRGFPDPAKTNWATSSAGATGPMQFLPSTWAGYATDGNGDGKKDINNLEDALYGGAKMLAANGGKADTPLGSTDKPLAPNTLLRVAASYNWGGGNVEKAGENATLDDLPTETADYMKAVYALISSDFTESPVSGSDNKAAPAESDPTTAINSSGTSCNTSLPGNEQGKGSFTDSTTIQLPGAAEAIARARQIAQYPPAKLQEICGGSPNCYRRCDRLTSVVWGRTSSGYATANLHWQNAPEKHPGDRNPPPGAILFYDSGSPAGHDATYLGNNLVLSNDVGDAASGMKGGAYIVSASDMENGIWNMEYLGWANPTNWGP